MTNYPLNTTSTNLLSGTMATYSISTVIPLVLVAGCIFAILFIAINSKNLVTFINKTKKILYAFIYAATGYIITYCGQLLYAIGETLGRLTGHISLYDIANFGLMMLLGYVAWKIIERIGKNIQEAYPDTVEDSKKGTIFEKT
jgi:hypothetical protein